MIVVFNLPLKRNDMKWNGVDEVKWAKKWNEGNVNERNRTEMKSNKQMHISNLLAFSSLKYISGHILD